MASEKEKTPPVPKVVHFQREYGLDYPTALRLRSEVLVLVARAVRPWRQKNTDSQKEG